MDWQLVASYFTVKSTDIFYSVVGLDKIPYAAYDQGGHPSNGLAVE